MVRREDASVHIYAKERDVCSQDSAYHSQDSSLDSCRRPMSRTASDLQSNSSRGERCGKENGNDSLRHISNTSTTVSGSENWETYDDNSEPEPDASEDYYAKLKAARSQPYARPGTAAGCQSSVHGGSIKRIRGIPPAHVQQVITIDGEGNRIASGGEWADEDAF